MYWDLFVRFAGREWKQVGRRMKNEWTHMNSPSNFERLVLGCIDSYDSDQRLILQYFSRSTRFAFLCTAEISKFQFKNCQKIDGMKKKKFHSFAFFDEFCDFSAQIWWKFVGISQKRSGDDKMSRDLEKKCQKNMENARNFQNWWEISFFISLL